MVSTPRANGGTVTAGLTSRLATLAPLLESLRADGYTVIGPTVSDGAIVLAELASARQLPAGWAVSTGPGHYRLHRRDDDAVFGHAAGPQGWKRFLHPPRTQLWSAQRDGAGFTVDASGGTIGADGDDTPIRYAFVGVRPCDLRAIAVQDRVLGVGRRYARQRREVFIVAVNCTEPASTCFCVSAGGGPGADAGFDLALTELVDDGTAHYLVEAGSEAGRLRLAELDPAPAVPDLVERGTLAVRAATTAMQRQLPNVDLRALLAETLEAPRWDDVAARCLACGNCTMACPTCFCTSVRDVTDLTGDHTSRWQEWASCFETDFSYLHGGPVRASVYSRYRQWLTHKLGTWHDQFGESGCVGCGRCIVWCPVGIDITEETTELSRHAEAIT